MSQEENVVLIADIDGTLGVEDQEIQETLFGLRSLLDRCECCLVTGRSLKGLARLQSALPRHVYVAPWGGGSLLFYDGVNYTPIDQIKRLSLELSLDDFTCVMIPAKDRYVESDERHILWADRVVSDGSPVSAYREISLDEPSSGESQQCCTHITTGRGACWAHVSPFSSPRVETVRWFRDKYPKRQIVYLGDSPIDGTCIDVVDYFLTHRASRLSDRCEAIVYDKFSDLPSVISDLIKAM